jgi:hypothetical protein
MKVEYSDRRSPGAAPVTYYYATLHMYRALVYPAWKSHPCFIYFPTSLTLALRQENCRRSAMVARRFPKAKVASSILVGGMGISFFSRSHHLECAC